MADEGANGPQDGAQDAPEAAGTDAPQQQPEQSEDKDWKAEAEKWKAHARKHEQAAKKLAQLEDEQKSEQEKLTERLSELEKKATEAETRAMRLSVMNKKGISEDLASRLQGSTEEELLADADKLLEQFGGRAAPMPDRSRPRPEYTPFKANDGDKGGPQESLSEWMRRRGRKS